MLGRCCGEFTAPAMAMHAHKLVLHPQVVDAAISESVFNMMEACVSEYLHAGVERQPSGSTISGVVPSGTFKTKARGCVLCGCSMSGDRGLHSVCA